MLHQKNIPILEYENLTLKNEYDYLYKKDEELKVDKVTDENEGFGEYGNDFLNCKLIHSQNFISYKHTFLSKNTNTFFVSSIF